MDEERQVGRCGWMNDRYGGDRICPLREPVESLCRHDGVLCCGTLAPSVSEAIAPHSIVGTKRGNSRAAGRHRANEISADDEREG